ncbi:MAG: hypothetical protein V4739_01185 [Pseudomonadota bacterium]
MKKVLIVLALGSAAGWWYFIGGRQVTQEDVQAFYRAQEHALLKREPAALCALLDAQYQANTVVTTQGREATSVLDKAEACEASQAMFDLFQTVGEKMGGIVQLDSGLTVDSVTLTPNRQSAEARITQSLDVAGAFMRIRLTSTDTLVRRNGKVLLLRSEVRSQVSSAGR